MATSREVVVDASVVLAVLLNEPEKTGIVEATRGKSLLAPGCLRWEIGNAFSALLKRNRLTGDEVNEALAEFATIPVNEIDVDLQCALALCAAHSIYAYDAYYLEAAKRRSRPLMTLDGEMKEAAEMEKIKLEEI